MLIFIQHFNVRNDVIHWYDNEYGKCSIMRMERMTEFHTLKKFLQKVCE